MARRRLDVELVRRGLARSREHSRELISAGLVRVGGVQATKPASQVDEAAPLVVDESEASRYVSRGAYKLLGALDAFAGLSIVGRRALDAGASTGGFTQVLLERGCSQVTCVDVGYGQLAWALRTDPRVVVMERTNVRDLTVEALGHRPGLVVSDLSFIPLAIVVPVLAAVAADDADLLVMVKPQFEVGRERVGRGGVVRLPEDRVWAVSRVADAAWARGLGTAGVAASPLPGPSGNVEYFLWLARGAPAADPDVISRVVAEGPQ